MDEGRRRLLAASGSALLLGAARADAAPLEWPEAPADTQGLATAALEGVFADAAAIPRMRAIAIARNGYLVGERYYAGISPEQPLPINSCTKSVMSLLVGKALAEGKLKDLSQTVGELLPEAVAKVPHTPVADVTLRQILAGTSGIRYDYRRDMAALFGAADPVEHVLRLPRSDEVAARWSYNDAAISLLTPILERAHRKDLREVARTRLAAPLGAGDVRWSADRAGRPTAAAGLQLRLRDLLKIAWLMVDEGRWRGTQVVPASWVADSLQPHSAGAWPVPPIDGSSYGYLWFVGGLHGRRVAWAWGYGGQFALLVPSLRLAIATAAGSPPQHELVRQTTQVMALVARVVDAAA